MYNEVELTTAYVEQEEIVKFNYLSHIHLKIMKLFKDKILEIFKFWKIRDNFIFSSNYFIKLWTLITKENANYIKVLFDEPLFSIHSCIIKS